MFPNLEVLVIFLPSVWFLPSSKFRLILFGILVILNVMAFMPSLLVEPLDLPTVIEGFLDAKRDGFLDFYIIQG